MAHARTRFISTRIAEKTYQSLARLAELNRLSIARVLRNVIEADLIDLEKKSTPKIGRALDLLLEHKERQRKRL